MQLGAQSHKGYQQKKTINQHIKHIQIKMTSIKQLIRNHINKNNKRTAKNQNLVKKKN
jgi:hypothetical protein